MYEPIYSCKHTYTRVGKYTATRKLLVVDANKARRWMGWGGAANTYIIWYSCSVAHVLHFRSMVSSYISHCIVWLWLMTKLKSASGSVVVDALSCWFVTTISVSFRSGWGSLYSMTSSVSMPLNSRPMMPAYLIASIPPHSLFIYPFHLHMHFWLRNKEHKTTAAW